MELLILLVERRGELVSREEIAERLWGKDVFVDVDHSINVAIRKIRMALRDDSDQPRFLETVVGKGYRFVAPMTSNNGDSIPKPGTLSPPIQDASEPTVQSALPIASAHQKAVFTRPRLLLAAVAVFALFAVALVLNRSIAGRPPIKSLAVLPLKNLSGDANQDYLAEGMTEALIGRLAGIHGLRVTSRTSVMRFKDTQLSAPQIAEMLNVDALVEGSVMREGNRIRVSAQLIRARTDEHFWSDVYDRELKDVLNLYSEVTEAIAEQVRVQLSPEQRARLRSTPPVDPEAYEAYLKGRFFEMYPTLQANKSAESYFREAIQKDAHFALAYAGLADCYLDSGAYRWVRPQDAYMHAIDAIHNSIRLDGTLSEAHSSLGYLHWQYDWDWQAAEKEFRDALESNPSNVDAREGLLWYLAWSGRGAEALEELQTIRNSDPAYPLAALDESGIYYHGREYQALMEASRRALVSDPNNWSGHYFHAVSYDGLGQPAEAVPEYQKAAELSQGNTDALAGLAHAYASAGERSKAARILSQLQQQSKTNYVSPYMIAAVYAALEDKIRAFEFLEKAYQERSPDIAYFLKADLRLDLLRTDSRYSDLVHRVGFPP